jgi:hypothetical protein
MNGKVRKYFAALAAMLLAMVLAGCGSGNKEGAVTTGSALFGGVATVGDSACNQCHSATTDPVTGQTIVSEYQQGSPHNQDGLGCESCHGGGAMHNGVGPIPYPAPDANRCATCHDGKTTVAVNGVQTTAPITNSATDFTSSVHASGNSGNGPSNNRNTAPCFRCHTSEGAILSDNNGFTGDGDLLSNTTYQAAVPASTTYSAITCDTCHAHGGGLRPVTTRDAGGTLVKWNPSGLTNKANDQFNLCSSCHGLLTNDGKVMASGDVVYGNMSTVKVGHHEDDWYRTIATTHYDNLDNANLSITGYVVRKTGDTPCFDCHGHEARTNTRAVSQSTDTSYTAAGTIHYDSASATIYSDWAQSVHAGFMLAEKITTAQTSANTGVLLSDDVMNTGIQQAFNHADWSTTADQPCQRCHTATGASNFMTSPSTYDASKNSFTHLAGWTSSSRSSTQRELIYCWACHSNAANGVVRTPGAVPAVYTYGGNTVTFPDVGVSNTCVTCHSGRGNSDTVTNTAHTGTNYSSLIAYGSVAHHGPTAGTVFSAESHVGYEFPGQSYANVSYFQHDKIGTPAAEAATGSNGPCAACHMGDSSAYGKASHTFEAVTYTDSTATTISAINNPSLCAKCHSGTHEMTVAELQANKDEATNANQLLSDILKQANAQTNYAGTDMTAAAFLNGTTATVNDLGAVNNSSYLGSSDKGAYVHNRVYFKRLIFDSIDWAQNGALTGSITVPATYTEAAAWFGADATGAATRP